MMLNKVMLIGYLTCNPSIKYTTGGLAITNFSIAVNRIFTRGDEKLKEVDFFRIVAFGKLGENCTYLKKGQPAFIEGRIRNRIYTNKEGAQVRTTEIIAQNIQFLSRKPKENSTNDFKNTVQKNDKEADKDDLPNGQDNRPALALTPNNNTNSNFV